MKETNDVKIVRARAKTLYHKLKTDNCKICTRTEKLELHHILPLSVVVKNWKKKNNVSGGLVENDVTNILESESIIFNPDNCVTLCRVCHLGLHRLFGKTYGENRVEKVKRYINRQLEKFKEKN